MNQIFKLVSVQPSTTKSAFRLVSINSTSNSNFNNKCSSKSIFYINNRQSALNRYGFNSSLIRSFGTSTSSTKSTSSSSSSSSTKSNADTENVDTYEDSDLITQVDEQESVIEDYYDENGNAPKNMGYYKTHFLDKDILNSATTPKYRFKPEQENDKYDFDEHVRPNESPEEQDQVETKVFELDDKQLPYDYSAKLAEKSLRAHLNRFFLKVHPDLFYNNEEHQQVNQKSLTKLNNLLRNLEEYIKVADDSSNTTKLDKIPSQIEFVFFAEVDNNGRIVQVKQDFTFVDAPDSILTSKSALVQYVTELRFNVYRQLYALLEKSGISIPKNEKELLKNPKAVPTELNDDPWEEYFAEDPTKLTLSQQLEQFLNQYPVHNDTLRSDFAPEHQKLIDLLDEKKVFFYFGEQCKGDLDYMRHLGFREEAEFQIIHLKHNILALEFQEWSGLPIIIVDPQYYNLMEPGLTKRGFVVLEKDFDPSVSLSYIKEVVIPKTIGNFKAVAHQALRNRDILEEKTNKLERLLGSNVVIENLFSVNQKTMEKVRSEFNQAMTLVGELKIPAIQLLESNKADSWKDLPKTNLKEFEFEQWKLKNIETTEKDAIAFITGRESDFNKSGRVPSFESEIEKSERIHNKLDQIHKTQEQQKGKSDSRVVPLQLVDKSQFDIIQSTPFLNASCIAVDRLTSYFETPVKVPFLMVNKAVKHPLYDLQEQSKELSNGDFDQGMLRVDNDDEEDCYFDDEEDLENDQLTESLDEEEDQDAEYYVEEGENYDRKEGDANALESMEEYPDEVDEVDKFDEENELEEDEEKEKIRQAYIPPQDTSPENLQLLASQFSLSNLVPIESEALPKPLFISKIQFMTTGNNFDNIEPIPISKPIISKSKVSSAALDDGQYVKENSVDQEVTKQTVNEIIQETTQTNGISSDLEDFFSKLSQLEQGFEQKEESKETSLVEEKAQPVVQEEKEEQQEEEAITESIHYVEQKLSDFKWDHINLIISDHYRFIITEDNKRAFCFIPANFKEEELFMFLNSNQDSFDLINGGTSEKAQEEYRIKALLSIESHINQLKKTFNIKSLLIDNNNVPSKVAQYSFVKRFMSDMEKVEASKLSTFKSIAPYLNIVVSSEYSIDFIDKDGLIIEKESEYSNSKSVTVNVDNVNFNCNILLEYIFVTLSENSKFFRDLIERGYTVPEAPAEPDQQKVKEIINAQYGYERIKDANAPFVPLEEDDLKFIEKEEAVLEDMDGWSEDVESILEEMDNEGLEEAVDIMYDEILGEIPLEEKIPGENNDDNDELNNSLSNTSAQTAEEFLKSLDINFEDDNSTPQESDKTK